MKSSRSAPQSREEIAMRLQLAPFALAVAALFGTTVIASAQMQPAPGASSDGKAAMDATKSNMKPGTTTGSATRGPYQQGRSSQPVLPGQQGRRHRPRKITSFSRRRANASLSTKRGPQRGALLSWRIGRQPINAYGDDADASGATVVDAAHAGFLQSRIARDASRLSDARSRMIFRRARNKPSASMFLS